MPKGIFTSLLVSLLLLSCKVKSQRRIIPVKTILTSLTREEFVLGDSGLKVDYRTAYESGSFYLGIHSAIMINNTFLEIKGLTCSGDTVTCLPLNELQIFVGKKKGGYLVDTTTLLTRKRYDEGTPNQKFTITFNIFKSDYLYFYSPGFLVDEVDIKKLRKKLLVKNRNY